MELGPICGKAHLGQWTGADTHRGPGKGEGWSGLEETFELRELAGGVPD